MIDGLRRYWITFEGSDEERRRFGLERGCGVTAYDMSDARTLVDEVVWDGAPMLRIRTVVEDVDVSTLDVRHVIPNMAPPVSRGIWFPLGFPR